METVEVSHAALTRDVLPIGAARQRDGRGERFSRVDLKHTETTHSPSLSGRLVMRIAGESVLNGVFALGGGVETTSGITAVAHRC